MCVFPTLLLSYNTLNKTQDWLRGKQDLSINSSDKRWKKLPSAWAYINYTAASSWRVTRVVEYFPTSSIKASL